MIPLKKLRSDRQLPDKIFAPYQDTLSISRKFFRTDAGEFRYYYRFFKEEIKYYLSVSSLTKLLPTNQYLIKWMADMGYEEAKEYTEERSQYGNMMHQLQLDSLRQEKVDLKNINEYVYTYIKKNRLNLEYLEPWSKELTKDYIAWNEFIFEHNIRPIAIEIPVLSEKYKVGGRIDLVCIISIKEKGFFGEVYKRNSGDNKAGDPKMSTGYVDYVAIIDLKSGKKGFFQGHQFQINVYKLIWNTLFPDVLVEKCFNWAPKHWRFSTEGGLKYSLKDQTNPMWARILKSYLSIATELGIMAPKKSCFLITKPLDSYEDNSEAYRHITLSDALKLAHSTDGKGKSVIL